MIDSAPKQPENRMHLFDPVGLINDKYAQYGVRPRRATSSKNSFAGVGASGGGMRLSVEPKVGGSDSGGSSPRLWKSSSSRRHSPPTSPRFGCSNQPRVVQNQSQHQYPEPMSPNSRTQAIARGRRELMEMIKDIPESCYELSLRDIVEKKSLPSPPPPPPAPMAVVPPAQEIKKGKVVEKKFPKQEVSETPKDKKGKEEEKKSKKKKGSKKVGKSESKKKMMRNPSVDNGGFLLKTSVFPILSRKKKKRGLNQAPSLKMDPKPPPKGPIKGSDKHWWARKSRVSSESDRGGLPSESVRSTSTSSSSSTVSRHKQNPRFLPSCCSFFNDKKMIKAKK